MAVSPTHSLFGMAVNVMDLNVRVLKDGVRRLVDNFPDTPRSLRSLRLD